MTKRNLIFELKQIRHFYGDTKVLDIEDLQIEQGSITGIIGPNGSGKSTLLKLLAFAQQPTFGQVFYKGKEELPFSPTIRSKVTLLTQKPYLLKRTVFENVAYGLKIRKDTEKLVENVKKALKDVGLDYRLFAGRQWDELSEGEAQRVAMAARLVLKPEVLLLDEPIASVDVESAKLIRQASMKARDALDTTLIIASHDLQWLYSIADKQLSIYSGNIFSTVIENIIVGPFEKVDKNSFSRKVVKKFPNDQMIILNAPQNNESIAIIKKQNIAIKLKNISDGLIDNQLSGQIVSMLLEKNKNNILVTVMIQNNSFVLIVTPDQISNLDLYPGKNVVLNFSSNDVEWI